MQKGIKIEEGHLMPDHVHMLISITPRYGVARVVGFIEARVLSTLPGSSTVATLRRPMVYNRFEQVRFFCFNKPSHWLTKGSGHLRRPEYVRSGNRLTI